MSRLLYTLALLLFAACGTLDTNAPEALPGTSVQVPHIGKHSTTAPTVPFIQPLDSGQVAIDNLRLVSIEPENRCTPYDRDDYPYPQSIEQDIIDRQGGLFSPYDSTMFNDPSESDIEHIVAVSEAHDSGMCSRSAEEKKIFSTDLDNLTLATPRLNRFEKIGYDAAEWLPPLNQCWYVWTIAHVKSKHDLTVDRAEYNVLHQIVLDCYFDGEPVSTGIEKE